jgi:hypothetical protein
MSRVTPDPVMPAPEQEATMEARTVPIERSAGWSVSRRDRVLAILGALAGALAVSGSLLTWVNVLRRRQSTAVRGTSFGIGTLALVVGVVMIVAAVVWIVTSGPRIRAAAAVAILAGGAAATIAIGTGLATTAFLDQAVSKHGHHQKDGGGTITGTSPSGVGAAYAPGSTGSTTGPWTVGSNGGKGTSSVQPSGPVFQALAGGGTQAGGRGTTSTLAPGVFIALAGGVIGMFVGIWSLLTGRSPKVTAAPVGTVVGAPASPVQPPDEPTQAYAPPATPLQPSGEPTQAYAAPAAPVPTAGEPTLIIPRTEQGV